MSEKFSDIIIVGTDLAGLVAGAFLAKRGLLVTVLNFEKEVSYEKKNIQPNLVTHLESRLFKSILGRLGIVDQELNIIHKLDVPYQTVFPKHRLDVHQDRSRLFREIQREFPLDLTSIQSFYESIDHFESTLDIEKLQELILPKGLKQHFRFRQFVQKNKLDERIAQFTDSLGANDVVRAFIEAQVKFLAQTHSENPFLYAIAKVLSLDNASLFEVKGGLGHLKKLFLEKIEQYHGRIKNEARLEKINFNDKPWAASVQSVDLGGFEGSTRCRYLLWNEKIQKLQDYLPRKWRTRKFHQKIDKIAPKYYRFSCQFEVEAGVVPMGMKENLLWINQPDHDLTGTNYLHFHLASSKTSENLLLTVSYLLDADKLYQASPEFDSIHQQIHETVKHLMPFSEGRVHFRFPLLSPEKEEEGVLFPLEKTDYEIFRENAQANPVDQIAPDKFADLFPLSNRTPYTNLLLTSPEVLASLGFEGKFLLGLKTIDSIWNESEKSSRGRALRSRKVA